MAKRERPVMQEIMGLFLQVFRRLGSPSSPAFQLCLSVLNIVSQVPASLAQCPLSE